MNSFFHRCSHFVDFAVDHLGKVALKALNAIDHQDYGLVRSNSYVSQDVETAGR